MKEPCHMGSERDLWLQHDERYARLQQEASAAQVGRRSRPAGAGAGAGAGALLALVLVRCWHRLRLHRIGLFRR